MEVAITRPSSLSPAVGPSSEHDDYSVMLNIAGIGFTYSDYYLQVGEIPQEEGWVLHLSVVKWQSARLLEILLPILISEKVAFKMIQDKETCSSLLDGNLSISKVGKVLCIYPGNEKEAVRLAAQLIAATHDFKGPFVPTDALLGNIVYAGYRTLTPSSIDDRQRVLEDNYEVPFRLPTVVRWPFGQIANLKTGELKKILHTIYKPTGLLKSDAKGNVWKGLYVGKFFIPRPCVIKQGKSNMWSDDEGRDMKDRLKWQQELYKRLSPEIPLPRVIDLFEEGEDMYLVMEFITGVSLYTILTTQNASCDIWPDQAADVKLKVLDHLIGIIRIIGRMHEKGFVHRDITPVNFMVTNDKIVLIDTELSYDLNAGGNEPPFTFGTPGYMSPNQAQMNRPQIKDDLYGIGGMMIFSFTGLSPVCLRTDQAEELNRQLSFLTEDELLSDMISRCVAHDPATRPDLDEVNARLNTIRNRLIADPDPRKRSAFIQNVTQEEMKKAVQQAIEGLANKPTITRDGLWQTRVQYAGSDADTERIVFGKVPGIRDGMTGVIYVLSRLHAAGWDVSCCQKMINNTYDHVRKVFTQKKAGLTPGFYRGTAGIALAMSSCVKTGLLDRTEEMNEIIRSCFSVMSDSKGMADGMTGQGIAALSCRLLLRTEGFDNIIEQIVSFSVDAQEKLSKKNPTYLEDQIGTLLFLQAYLTQFEDATVASKMELALTRLQKEAHGLAGYIRKNGCKDYLGRNDQAGELISGLILCFIKGYSLLKDNKYRTAAESILRLFPKRITNDNFYQANGLAGLGELYLEAAKSLDTGEWNDRVEWIANFFFHTASRTSQNGIHWMGGNQIHVTADMMMGNSGIVHFLGRYTRASVIGYRLLS